MEALRHRDKGHTNKKTFRHLYQERAVTKDNKR